MAKILSARDDIASQVGGEAIRGPDLDGSGDPMFKSEDTLSAGYTDVTTLANWGLYGAQVKGLNYKDFRNILIADFVGTWATLTDAEKKTLIRHYVYDSAETPANLNSLHTQVERDDFQKAVMLTLNEVVETVIRRSNVSGSTKFFDHQTDDAGTLITVEITTDVELI